MRFNNPYWSNKLRIEALQRWIIVQSIIYYELDNSLVSDQVFDNNARQLVKMQNEHKDEAKQTQYWYLFYDFDGSTGFDLYDRLNKSDKQYLTQIAHHVLKLFKAGGQNGRKK